MSVRCRRFDDVHSPEAVRYGPGAFQWATSYGEPETIVGLIIRVPGVADARILRVYRKGEPRPHNDGRASWEWDGDEEAPTLSPSVGVRRDPHEPGRWRYHGWVRNGELVEA